MKHLTAARLIELLAQHIAEHGNAPVEVGCDRGGPEAVRCWWNDDHKVVVVGDL